MIAVEAAGHGINTSKHAARWKAKCTARKQNLLTQSNTATKEAHSISAGLDYPGIGPNIHLFEEKRVKYMSATDTEALEAFNTVVNEGIIPALEPAHALSVLRKIAKNYNKIKYLMNMCGRETRIFLQYNELKIKSNDDLISQIFTNKKIKICCYWRTLTLQPVI